jgi:N-glycosylase/DNA lyase
LPWNGATSIRLFLASGSLVWQSSGRLTSAATAYLETSARRILGLDLDLGEFHRRVSADPEFRWIAKEGLGRLLRAPTVFEDLVKLVLTTNCSWSLTKSMVRNLVDEIGEPSPDGTKAFPTPERMARMSEREWRECIRAGYRSPYLVRLCRTVADGKVDPESWDRSDLEPSALKREISSLPGAGAYVAENMLKLLGRPDGLGLDSWMRRTYAERFHSGRRVTDRTIARRLAHLGPWAGLALWFDLVGTGLEL